MKLLLVLFAVILSAISIYSEDVHQCYCDVRAEERTSCPAGGNLGEEDCLRNHCCYSMEESDVAPKCYERKARCENDRCEISKSERTPCGSWQLGEAYCQKLNCCYDRRYFPYCYQSNGDSTFANNEKKFSTRTQPNQNYDRPPIGPNYTYFDAKLSELIKVDCSASEKRKRCGDPSIEMKKCLESGCCWGPSRNKPSCFESTKTVVPPENLIEESELIPLFEDVEAWANDDVIEPLPEEDFAYDPAVIIECLNIEIAGISKNLCPPNTRDECLDSGCCWNGTNCLEPVSHLSNNTDDIDIPFVDALNKTNKESSLSRAVIAIVNIDEDIDDMHLACDGSKTAKSCGSYGITRRMCLENGCCWSTQHIPQGACTVPMLVEDKPHEQTTTPDLNVASSAWSSWGNWSSCYIIKPCAQRAARERWRKCIHTGNFGGEVQCKLQTEQKESVPCFKPTECLDTHWSDWGAWSRCSESCGLGTQHRQRECVKSNKFDNKNAFCETANEAFMNLIKDEDEKDCNSFTSCTE